MKIPMKEVVRKEDGSIRLKTIRHVCIDGDCVGETRLDNPHEIARFCHEALGIDSFTQERVYLLAMNCKCVHP